VAGSGTAVATLATPIALVWEDCGIYSNEARCRFRGRCMPSLYVETSIVSYLRSRPSAQVVAAARQLLTRKWWEIERPGYELVTSQ